MHRSGQGPFPATCHVLNKRSKQVALTFCLHNSNLDLYITVAFVKISLYALLLDVLKLLPVFLVQR